MKKKSETKLGNMPIWFHRHRDKMRVKKLDLDRLTLVIANNAAQVQILGENVNGWLIRWEVIFCPHSKVGDYKVNGLTYMNNLELAYAFGLNLDDYSGKYGQWLISRFGADCAEQGKFIRYKDYLNIPGPGTGNNGDPNVSITLDDEIKNSVGKLLQVKYDLKNICEKCGAVGEWKKEQPILSRFVCKECGYEKICLLRREMTDLDDSVEGRLMVDIAGHSLK